MCTTKNKRPRHTCTGTCTTKAFAYFVKSGLIAVKVQGNEEAKKHCSLGNALGICLEECGGIGACICICVGSRILCALAACQVLHEHKHRLTSCTLWKHSLCCLNKSIWAQPLAQRVDSSECPGSKSKIPLCNGSLQQHGAVCNVFQRQTTKENTPHGHQHFRP